MTEFLHNNLANIIISAILIVAVVIAIIKIKKNKGSCGCNGNCSCCDNACSNKNNKTTPTKKD